LFCKAFQERYPNGPSQLKQASTLYSELVATLLKDSGLLRSSSGKRRCTYCFRHTYATFRLSEGVNQYMLATQMGTSVEMIEEHYGHIVPVKNAERILQRVSSLTRAFRDWDRPKARRSCSRDGKYRCPATV
jgi:integrase